MKRLVIAAFLGATFGAPVIAQTPSPERASQTPVDATRLKMARGLMDQIMPPATREQMMASMMKAMSQNILKAMRSDSQLAGLMEKDPRAQAVFDQFMQRQFDAETKDLNDNLPGMLDAMAHAYARRFTTEQLRDLTTFFATPTGRAYLVQAPTVMADPDVAAWMGALMNQSMKRMPDETNKLVTDLTALEKSDGHGS
ncbi:MAG: DUF2059 domain-containing protein [Pseudomonadota bacterium]|nr:DUF2059 domain-containing protein [Pseudomonadota bacterium]